MVLVRVRLRSLMRLQGDYPWQRQLKCQPRLTLRTLRTLWILMRMRKDDEEDYEDAEEDDEVVENTEWQEETAVQVFVDWDLWAILSRSTFHTIFSSETWNLLCSIASQIAVIKSLQPTIASTRSCHSLDHPNYALDVRELKEEGNYIKRDLLHIDLPRVSSKTKFNSILKLFRAGKKKEEGETSWANSCC